MIAANELRLGNWVEHMTNGNKWQITISDFVEEYEMGQAMFHMKPIPLTPEILEKCGFQLAPQRISIYEKGLLRLWLGHTGCIAYLINKDTRESHYIRDIQHLHQLQNLYFALTGEELEIKL